MTTKKTSPVQFFFKHAGFSYDPKTETKLQGRWRCARDLAKAEHYAKEHGWSFGWEDDWSVGSHVKFFGTDGYPDGEPDTCESCVLYDADGQVLESLGCIDGATTEYRRVIEAELALEAMSRVEQASERDTTSAGDVPLVQMQA